MTADKSVITRRIMRYIAVLNYDGLQKLVAYAAALYRNQYEKEKKRK